MGRRGICVDCLSFYCRWQLLSVLPALTPGPEVAGDMAVAVVVSMAAVAEAFAVVTVAEAFVVVTVEAGSAVVTEVIEAATAAGDMDAVTATEAVGGTG